MQSRQESRENTLRRRYLAYLRVPLFVSSLIIKSYLLHIIPHICAQTVTLISSNTLIILLNLSCYENAAFALDCNGCTVANDAIATTLR